MNIAAEAEDFGHPVSAHMLLLYVNRLYKKKKNNTKQKNKGKDGTQHVVTHQTPLMVCCYGMSHPFFSLLFSLAFSHSRTLVTFSLLVSLRCQFLRPGFCDTSFSILCRARLKSKRELYAKLYRQCKELLQLLVCRAHV